MVMSPGQMLLTHFIIVIVYVGCQQSRPTEFNWLFSGLFWCSDPMEGSLTRLLSAIALSVGRAPRPHPAGWLPHTWDEMLVKSPELKLNKYINKITYSNIQIT